MDDRRFDALSRGLGQGISRRRALAAAFGVLLGGAGVAAGLEPAGATRPLRGRAFRSACTADRQCRSPLVCRRERGLPRTERNRCGCPAGQTWCPDLGLCVVIGSADHCTGCGDACPGGATCCADQATCAVLASDVDHCGACGDPCDPARADGCSAGSCACGGGPACAGNQFCREGACVEATCDPGDGHQVCMVDTDGVTRDGCGIAVGEYRNGDPMYCSANAECARFTDETSLGLCAVGANYGQGYAELHGGTGSGCVMLVPVCPG
jgi:hypothetical protein